MSSVLSGFKGRSDLPIPNGAVVLTYESSANNDTYVPVPFTYSNGTLDMDFSGDFASDTVVSENRTAFLRYSAGAHHLVTAIGPNLVAWMENRGGADAGSVSIYENAVVIHANTISIGFTPDGDSATGTNTTPFNFSQSWGGANNNFFSTYLFQKALVLKYTVSGSTRYRFFNTQIGERNT